MATVAKHADPSVIDASDVALAVAADIENGLTAQESARRLAANGRNELHAAVPVPTWRRVLAHFQDPLIYLLMAAIAIALGAWAIEGMVGWPVDASVITIVVLVNGVLGFVQQVKADNAVGALARMTQASSAVMRDGKQLRVPSAELVVGDLLLRTLGVLPMGAELQEAVCEHPELGRLLAASGAARRPKRPCRESIVLNARPQPEFWSG